MYSPFVLAPLKALPIESVAEHLPPLSAGLFKSIEGLFETKDVTGGCGVALRNSHEEFTMKFAVQVCSLDVGLVDLEIMGSSNCHETA